VVAGGLVWVWSAAGINLVLVLCFSNGFVGVVLVVCGAGL
jgi:hypothetical protein